MRMNLINNNAITIEDVHLGEIKLGKDIPSLKGKVRGKTPN